MSSKLKMLGLTLVAVFAVSATMASGAMAATGHMSVTSVENLDEEEFQFHIDGTEVEAGPVFTGFGESVSCPGTTYFGGELIAPANTIPFEPTYNNANCKDGSHKATITDNGCHLLFHIGETIGTDEYGGLTDLVCPAGKDVELHVYLAENNENIKACSVTVKPQTGLTGITFTNNTAAEDVNLGGPVVNVAASKSGLCGAGETKEARLDFNVTMKGTNNAGEPIGIGVVEF